MVATLFFFHPAVWLSTRMIDRQRERARDCDVLDHALMSPRQYGLGIVGALRLALPRAIGSAALGGDLAARIRLIAARDPRRRSRRLTVLAALLLATPVLALVPTGNREEPSAWRSPLPEGRISSQFGTRRDPFSGEQRFHQGIDLAAEKGTPILAPAAGTVLRAEQDASVSPWGRMLILVHEGGDVSFFGHLNEIHVATGARVAAGSVIGTVGDTGLVTGPHLHFEVRSGGHPIDPATRIPQFGEK